MKKLANLNGVKALSKMEQKSINGGSHICPIPQNESQCLEAGGYWVYWEMVCVYPTNYCL